MSKYIILNPTKENDTMGGVVVFESKNGKASCVVSLFGLKISAPKLLIDDLVNVRQFDIAPGFSEIELDDALAAAKDIVVGVFDGDMLVATGSSFGLETDEQKQRLCLAIEKKDALSHFKTLAKDAAEKFENSKKSFFQNLEFLLFELFAYGVPDSSISKFVPNSKWVKLFLNRDVLGVGVVEKAGEISAVGLAVPVLSKSQKHALVDSSFTFFPQNKTSPNGFGYYIVLQSAKNGAVQKL